MLDSKRSLWRTCRTSLSLKKRRFNGDGMFALIITTISLWSALVCTYIRHTETLLRWEISLPAWSSSSSLLLIIFALGCNVWLLYVASLVYRISSITRTARLTITYPPSDRPSHLYRSWCRARKYVSGYGLMAWNAVIDGFVFYYLSFFSILNRLR